MELTEQTTYNEFEKIDIRVGTIIEVSLFPKARKSAFQLQIDFGDLGIKKSSAQITELYSSKSLVGTQVIAVINFPPKQIANFVSECLVLGVVTPQGVILLRPEQNVKNGSKIS